MPKPFSESDVNCVVILKLAIDPKFKGGEHIAQDIANQLANTNDGEDWPVVGAESIFFPTEEKCIKGVTE